MISLSEKVRLNVPIGALWTYLRNTDQLNRSIGLYPVSFEPDRDPDKKGHYRAVTKALGLIPLRYEEFPFEWVENRYYKVLRVFESGPFRWISGGIRVKALDPGVELEVFADVEPRFRIAGILAKVALHKMAIKDVIQFAKTFEDRWLQKASITPPKAEINYAVLDARAAALKSDFKQAELVNKLIDALKMLSDIDVTRMRAFTLADQWKTDRFETLKMFLHAVKSGLVDMVWDVICPHCRAEASKDGKLAGIKSRQYCKTCGINFDVDLSELVEVTFKVNPGVRVARREIYCIGGPASTPEVGAQLRLEPGALREETLDAPFGATRVRCYPPHALKDVKIRISDEQIKVENKANIGVLLAIEKEIWRKDAATAAMVVSMQDFRLLFPEESVAPGAEIAIGLVALLFTDLQGSTALYQQVGDAKAFDFVQRHFRFLIDKLAANRGGLVKTIGDAVMASFYAPKDAVAAAVAMQREWGAFMKKHSLPTSVGLRVGVHHGASIAINNDGKLDYFGTTVNMAARVESVSKGGDVVISAAVQSDPETASFLAEAGVIVEPFSAQLKGILIEQNLFRLTLPA